MARYDARKLRNGMKYEISNEFLKVKADTEGAILWSVTDKDGFEYIWQGDDRYWNEHGANLFPYIARLWEKSYIFQGKTYHMDIHGFAKDSVFSCEKAGENELVFAMEDTRETLEQYPFHFRFEIRYLLEKNTLKVFYSVKNKDEKTMYFGIGGHRDLIFRWKRDFPLRIMNWNFPGHVSRSAFFFHRSVLWRGRSPMNFWRADGFLFVIIFLMKMLLCWRKPLERFCFTVRRAKRQ